MRVRAFEELDWQPTAKGTLSLRRRRLPGVDADVFEVKLGDDFLMTSRFTTSEVALAERALAMLEGDGLAVVVGGLGLGHSAAAVLGDPRVGDLVVVEALAPVIAWHRRSLVPLGRRLVQDARCRLREADFFALAASAHGFDPDTSGRRFEAVLVDIDHAPDDWLAPEHAAFYGIDGLEALARHLRPGGIFALWSNEGADAPFLERLKAVFVDVAAHSIHFADMHGRMVEQTVYCARNRV